MHPFRAAYFVHVKSCSLVSPVTAVLFSGPSLSSDKVDARPDAAHANRSFGYENVLSESSDSESEGSGKKESSKNTVLMKIHEFVQFHETPEVRMETGKGKENSEGERETGKGKEKS